MRERIREFDLEREGRFDLGNLTPMALMAVGVEALARGEISLRQTRQIVTDAAEMILGSY